MVDREPEFLTLEEAFRKEHAEGQDDMRDQFLSDLRDRLISAEVHARGAPNGQTGLEAIASTTWRTHVPRFDIGGCAVGQRNAEANAGAAWARLTESPHVRPYDSDREAPYWLGLLFPRAEISGPSRLPVEGKKSKGGRPPGQGSLAPADVALIAEMKSFREAEPHLSDTGAARRVVDRAEGAGTPESKLKRLVVLFKKTYPS